MPIQPRSRLDPYKNFKFKVKWGGRYVAGVTQLGPLKRNTELTKQFAETGKLPPLQKFPTVTLKRVMVHDPAFAAWITWHDPRAKRTLTIEHHEGGRKLAAYKVRSAWPSKFTRGEPVVPETALAIEELELENEGVKPAALKPGDKRVKRRR